MSLLLVFCFVAVAAADASDLSERTVNLIDLAGRARTAAQRDSVRIELSAAADSLVLQSDHALAARALNRVGILIFRGGDVSSADSVWVRGLELAELSGDRAIAASLLNSHAIGVSAGGDLERGATLFEQLADLRRELGDVRGEGVSLTNLARARMQLFRLPEADRALRRALECHRAVGNLDGLAQTFMQRAQILLELKDAESALAMSDSAVVIAEQGAPKRTIAIAYADRGWIRQQSGDPEGGLADLNRGIEGLFEIEEPVLAENARLNRAVTLVDLGRYDEALSELTEVESARAAREEDRGVVVARSIRGFALLESGRTQEARKVLEQAIDELDHLRGELQEESSRVSAFRIGGHAYGHLSRCLLELDDHRTAWEVAESGRSSRLRTRIDPAAEVITLEELQAELRAANAQVLHYGDLSGSIRSVFFVRPDTLIAGLIEMPPSLGNDIQLAAYLIGSGVPDEKVQPVLERIAEALLRPIEHNLSAQQSRLLISLPRGFAGLPFEALPTKNGRLLVEDWSVSETPSATSFVQLQRRESWSGAPLAFADPTVADADDYEQVLASRFRDAAAQPLPFARQEARSVVSDAGHLVVGREATKTQLDQLPEVMPGVIHFATHAVIDPIRASSSALLLAGRGREAALTAAEVEELILPADLVTLSGCRTATGLPMLGEGTLGLSRAFLIAGARSVVMSRWDVEDGVAAEFMELFYDGLREARPRDEALQRAQLTLAERGRPLRDWAAFVLIGAPADAVPSLEMGAAGRGSWLLLGAALLIAAVLGARLRGRRSSR